ncbi:MAG: N-acetyltransferase family protein [Acidimicrobiales bacterium]
MRAPSTSLGRRAVVGSVIGVEIRTARPEDAGAIRSIYNAEVAGSTVTFDLVERTVTEHEEWMAQHSGVYPLVVATDGAEVVGFASLSPYRPRPAYSTTVEDSVYVARAYRGNGVGKALLAELVARARMHGFHSVIARIVGDHEASIALHRSCGFELVGTEHEVGRKFGRWLDVDLMQLLL